MITSIYSGGYKHPFEETAAALKEIAQDCGGLIDQYDRLDDPLDLSMADMVIINGLWWSMTQDEKYAADRDACAFELSDAQMDEIERFVMEGGALYAVHTSVICFDTQPRWKALLGGGWTWGTSHHPPYGPLNVDITDAGRACDLQPFSVVDEAYHALDPADDVKVLATCDTGDGAQPIAWLRKVGEGSVAVNALGHDAASMMSPGHKALMDQQIYWLINDQHFGLDFFP